MAMRRGFACAAVGCKARLLCRPCWLPLDLGQPPTAALSVSPGAQLQQPRRVSAAAILRVPLLASFGTRQGPLPNSLASSRLAAARILVARAPAQRSHPVAARSQQVRACSARGAACRGAEYAFRAKCRGPRLLADARRSSWRVGAQQRAEMSVSGAWHAARRAASRAPRVWGTAVGCAARSAVPPRLRRARLVAPPAPRAPACRLVADVAFRLPPPLQTRLLPPSRTSLLRRV